jgi:hypothetical protein
MATTSFSKQLLAQSSIDVEMTVRNDLALAHAGALDLAALDGTGTSINRSACCARAASAAS